MGSSVKRALALITLLLLLQPVHSVYEGDRKTPGISIEDPIIKPEEIEPGDQVDLWFKVFNIGSSKACNVVLEIVPKYPFSVEGKRKSELGDLEVGGLGIAHFRLRVDSEARSGLYEIELRAKFLDEMGRKRETYKRIQIPVLGKAEIEVHAKSDTIKIGEEGEIEILVKNSGSGIAKNTKISILSRPIQEQMIMGPQIPLTPQTMEMAKQPTAIQAVSREEMMKEMAFSVAKIQPMSLQPETGGETTQYPVSILGASEVYLGNLSPGESAIARFRLYASQNAIPGAYILPIRVDYEEEVEQIEGSISVSEISDTLSFRKYITKTKNLIESRSKEFFIGIKVIGKISVSIGNVLTTPREIRPGNRNVIVDIEIQNSGDERVEDLEIEIIPKHPFSLAQSSERYLGVLRSGEYRIVSFSLDISEDATEGEHEIPLILKFRDPYGEIHEERRSAKVVIRGKPVIKVVGSEVVPEARPGKKSELRIEVKNVGTEEGESVLVRALKKAEQPFDFEVKSDYIGNLLPGEKGTAVLVFEVKEGARAKEYLLTVEIRVVGDTEKGDYNVYTFEDKVPIKISLETRERKERVVPLLVVIVFILIALALLFSMKFRKSTG